MASILKRRNPSGKIVYKVQFKDQYGKRHEIAAGHLKKHAEALLSTVLEQVNAGTYGIDKADDLTLSEFYEKWIKAKEKALKPSTFASYKNTFNKHIIPTLGTKRLNNISPIDIQGLVDNIAAKDISPATVGRIYRYLRACLRQAYAWDAMKNNPCRNIILPRINKDEMIYLTPDEIRSLLEKANVPFRALFALLAMSGLRVGEALALAWRHINFEQNTIIVERAYDYWGGIQEPKTVSSRRAVPMLPNLKQILDRNRSGNGNSAPEDLLFATRSNKPIDHSNVRKEFEKALTAAKLKKVTVHSLRHSYASTMLASGASIKALQRSLGHASATLTLNTYSHLIEESMGASIIRADSLFKGTKKGEVVALEGRRKKVRNK